LKIHRSTCSECAKTHRGAYEAILQIRAKRRLVGEEERLKILDFIQSLVKRTQLERSEFAITKVKQTHHGLDLYFSSHNIAKKISNAIVSEFGCSHKSSEKIAGRDKSGRTQFKAVYSLRLPDFRPGDVIEWNGRNYLLDSISGGKAHVIDISTDQKTTIPLSEAWRASSIIKKESLTKFLILAVEETTIDLMNSKTYEVLSINKPSWSVKAGVEVYGFTSKNGIISLIPHLK
jgi:nonsense-mediated mRNA decay protein 3